MAVFAAALVLGQTPTTADEAYVRAGKIAQELKLEAHLKFLKELVRFRTGAATAPPEALGKFTATTKPNLVRRRIAEIIAKVSPWIETGNRLPVAEPEQKETLPTLFESFVRNGFAAAAQYRFSTGDPRLGIELWRQATDFGLQYERSTLGVFPATNFHVDQALSEIFPYIDGLSAEQLRVVEKQAQRLLLPPDYPAIRSRAELEQLRSYLPGMFKELEDYVPDIPLGQYATKIKPEIQPAIRREVYEAAKKLSEARIAAFGKTEADWYRLKPTSAEPTGEWPKNPVRNDQQFVAEYLDWAMPDSLGWNTKRLGRRQSHVRQLILRCKVLRYRWENDKLPGELKDVVPLSETVDPFSERRFEYEQKWNGFRIWSYWRGTDDILELQAPRN
jgi:hypothetical protein